MSRGEWPVDLHDDDVNGFPGIAYVLHQVCGLTPEQGVALADEVHRRGTTRLISCDTRDEAERLAAEIQLYGVRATVGHRDQSGVVRE